MTRKNEGKPVIIDFEKSVCRTALYYRARKKIFLERSVKEGFLCIWAWQFFRVWVNGQYLGRSYVRHHQEEMRYEKYKLSGMLRKGENVIAVEVHAWAEPDGKIPGVESSRPAFLAVAGYAGQDLNNASGWKVAVAGDFLPAPRHNSLIGHEEFRDMRLEPAGWNNTDFDDTRWFKPVFTGLPGKKFVKSTLRHLKEVQVFPARIVKQGSIIDCDTWQVKLPSKEYNTWKIEFNLVKAGGICFACNMNHLDTLCLDGREYPPVKEGEVPWSRSRWYFLEEKLSSGMHVIEGKLGEFSSGLPFRFGWQHEKPAGGDRIVFMTSGGSVFEPSPVDISSDSEGKIILGGIRQKQIIRLGREGVTRGRIEKSDVALVFEFKKNMTLHPRIEIEDASSGVELEICYSEQLSREPGLLVNQVYRDTVILRAGAQTWENAFQYKSCRVLIVNVRAGNGFVKFKRISAIYRHYDYEYRGGFGSSDKLLKRIWSICRNTMEFGSQDIIMDGPMREQLLYMGDNYVHNQACFHLFGNHEIVEWQHLLYARGQMPDGIICTNQPYRPKKKEYRLLDQTILWPIELRHHLLYTGNQKFVAELFPKAIKLMDGFDRLFGESDKDDPRLRNIIGWNWIDHPGKKDGKICFIRNDGIATGINILYLMAMQSILWLGRHLNMERRTVEISSRAELLAKQLRMHHWDAERRLFTDCFIDGKQSTEASVHINILAILAGLADDPGGLLDRTWQKPGITQIVGPFFRVHLFEVLDRLGRYSDILAEIRKLWGNFVKSGLTSTPEYGEWDWPASLGHPWGASPAIYLVKSIAGLRPLAPGWKEAEFNPHLCGLKHVFVTVPTPFGPFSVDLKKKSGKITATFDKPDQIKLHFAAFRRPYL